jgi:hypothetical protein
MKKSPIELINLSISALMVIITFAGALIFLGTDLLSDKAFGTKRIVLGVVFLAYSIYRSYRIYVSFKPKKDNNGL